MKLTVHFRVWCSSALVIWAAFSVQAQDIIIRRNTTTTAITTSTTTVSKPKAKPQPKQKSTVMTAEQRQCIIDNLINNMVYVEGGTFMMGATPALDKDNPTDKYGNKVEREVGRKVTVSSFYIGKFEVTQEEWDAVMGRNPKRWWNSKSNGKKKPAYDITWYESVDFCNKLCSVTKRKIRLPSEAEWEYAARGGNKSLGYVYPGGNHQDDVGWYDKNSNISAQVVGKKVPNELGLFDMGGNIAEWCLDWYVSLNELKNDIVPSMNPVVKDLPSAKSDGRKVCRGGAYYLSVGKVNYRDSSPPNRNDGEHGFRIVMEE